MSASLHAGPLEIRASELTVIAGGRAIVLSPQEFAVLIALASRTGEVVSREEVHVQAWATPRRAGDRSVDVYVRRLRRRLAAALPGWSVIHTHRGVGYRLDPIDRQRDGNTSPGARA